MGNKPSQEKASSPSSPSPSTDNNKDNLKQEEGVQEVNEETEKEEEVSERNMSVLFSVSSSDLVHVERLLFIQSLEAERVGHRMLM